MWVVDRQLPVATGDTRMDAIDLMFLKYAAKNYHVWGRWAAVRYCARRGISRKLLTLARQLHVMQEEQRERDRLMSLFDIQ